MNRLTAVLLLLTFPFTVTLEGRAFASHLGGPNAAGSAGAPAGRILEAFHSDLSTGRAVFGLPLAVPPGRRGLQPNLSLGYSSSAKNGPLGVGWNLELGCIERSTRFSLPQFNNADLFTLRYGGVSSDLVEVTPGEYRLKEEHLFAKILFNGARWTVTSKDGATATFGATGDSVQTVTAGTLAWFLNEVRDIHGNVMTLAYTSSRRQVYPASIRYTAHPATGLSPTHEVRFTWQPRPDTSWDERFGDRIETAQRLSVVEAFTQGILVRRYRLEYTQSPLTGRSLLSSLTTVGSDGTTSLPPVTLRYSNTFGGWTLSTAWSNPHNGGNHFNFVSAGGLDIGFRFTELDGDGLVDLLEGKWDNSFQHAWINTGAGWRRDNRWKPPHAFVTDQGGDLGGRLADFNGDGRTDLYCEQEALLVVPC